MAVRKLSGNWLSQQNVRGKMLSVGQRKLHTCGYTSSLGGALHSIINTVSIFHYHTVSTQKPRMTWVTATWGGTPQRFRQMAENFTVAGVAP